MEQFIAIAQEDPRAEVATEAFPFVGSILRVVAFLVNLKRSVTGKLDSTLVASERQLALMVDHVMFERSEGLEHLVTLGAAVQSYAHVEPWSVDPLAFGFGFTVGLTVLSLFSIVV